MASVFKYGRPTRMIVRTFSHSYVRSYFSYPHTHKLNMVVTELLLQRYVRFV